MKAYERANQLAGDSLADELPMSVLDGGVLVNRDLTLATGWRLTLGPCALLDEPARADLGTRLRALLNTLPENIDVQMRWLQSNRRVELEGLLAGRGQGDGYLARCVRESDRRLLEDFAAGRLSWQFGYLFLVRRPQAAEVDPDGVGPDGRAGPWWRRALRKLRPGGTAAAALALADEASYLRMRGELEQLAATVTGPLEAMGVEPRPMTEPEWMAVMAGWWEKRRFELGAPVPAWRPSETASLAEYASAAFAWDPRGLVLPRGVAVIDGCCQGILSLLLPPDVLSPPLLAPVFARAGLLRCEVVVNATHASRQQRLRRLSQLQKRTPAKSVNEALRAQLDEELQRLGAGDESCWRASTFFRVWGDTPEEVEQACLRLQAAAEEAGGMRLSRETWNLWGYLRAMAPGYTSDRDRFRLLEFSGTQLACLLPWWGVQPQLRPRADGSITVGALLRTYAGSVVNWDPGDPALTSEPHVAVAAGSGKGKSVFAALVALELIGSDGRAVFIDRGGSFRRLAEADGGAYVNLETGAAARKVLNPLFVRRTRGERIDAETLSLRRTTLEGLILAVRGEGAVLRPEESQILHEQLRFAYDRSEEELTLTTFVTALNDTGERDARGLARALQLYTRGGQYGEWFDGPNQVTSGGRISVIDLGKLGGDVRLQRILALVMLTLLGELVGKLDGRRKLVVFDELGILLEDPLMRSCVDLAFRSFRKLGVVAFALSQKPTDLLHLAANCGSFVLLGQSDARETARVAEALGISPLGRAVIDEATTVYGEYAQGLLVQRSPQGQRLHPIVVVSTPLRYALTTSHPPDAVAITHLQAAHPHESMPEILARFAARHPQGVR